MHLRIKFTWIFFLISAVLFLTCKSSTQRSTEITFWGMGSEGEVVQTLLPEFEQQNPGIRVKVQMIPWTAAQEKLITAYASENLPDAFQLGNTWIPQFVALNAIEKLDGRIAQSRTIHPNNYFSGIWNTNIINQSLYGIPWYIDTRVLFYRTDILKKANFQVPPKTWDELYRLSKQIRILQGDRDEYAIYLPTNEWATFVIFSLQAGAQLLKEDNCYGNFNSPEFKKAFRFLIRFHREKLAPIGISQVSNVYQAFADGYFAMYISGPWNVKEFKRWMKDTLADEWMTAPLPAPDEHYPGVSLAGGSSLVMSQKSRHKKAVWKFFEYLSVPTVQIKFFRLSSDLPAVRSAWQDTLLQNDPYMKAFYEQFHHVVATPKIAEWEQIAFSKIQQYAEMAARGVLTVDEALRRLDTDVDRILEKRRWLLHKQ